MRLLDEHPWLYVPLAFCCLYMGMTLIDDGFDCLDRYTEARHAAEIVSGWSEAVNG